MVVAFEAFTPALAKMSAAAEAAAEAAEAESAVLMFAAEAVEAAVSTAVLWFCIPPTLKDACREDRAADACAAEAAEAATAADAWSRTAEEAVFVIPLPAAEAMDA